VRAKLGPAYTVEPHWDEGKHLYWRALSAAGDAMAGRLKLDRRPYPKPEGGPRVGH
jgi:hypothetical protein